MTEYKEVRTTQHESGQEQRVATFKATQIIWLLFGLILGLIGLRIVFKLIAVNPDNPFAAFLYNVSGIFVAPFESLLGAPTAGGMVLEISSIIAMIVYLLIAWALVRVVDVLFYRPRGGPVSVKQTIVADQPSQQAPLPDDRQTNDDE
jgi:uncharacterized protein YggT (Ycf19 family)